MSEPVIYSRKKVVNSYKTSALCRGFVKEVKTTDDKLNIATVMLADSGIELPNVEIPSAIAHNKTGIVSLPMVDDEVLIGFIDGDMKSPVILASLYNSKQLPPLTVEDKGDEYKNKNNDNIRIVLPADKSDKGKQGLDIVISCAGDKQNVKIITQQGYALELDDAKDKGKIEFRDKKDAGKAKNAVTISFEKDKGSITLKAEKTITMQVGKKNKIVFDEKEGLNVDCGAGEVKVKAGEKGISLDAKQKMDLKSGQDLSIKSSNGKLAAGGQGVEIKSSAQNIDVKATQNMNLSANMSMGLKANTQMQIQGQAQTAIKGGIVNIN